MEEITIITQTHCPMCKIFKNRLAWEGIAFTEVDAETLSDEEVERLNIKWVLMLLSNWRSTTLTEILIKKQRRWTK